MDGPLPGEPPQKVNRDFSDDFSGKTLSLHYNFLRNPHKADYQIKPEEKKLILKGTPVTLNEADSPTWIGVRQKGFETVSMVNVSLVDEIQGMRAGLSAYYNDSYHYEIYLTKEQDGYKVCLSKHIHDMFAVTASAEIPAGKNVFLKMVTDRTYYRFSYSLDGEHFTELGSGLVVGLCTEGTRTMTFTGTYIAMFAENGDGAFSDFRVKVLDY